MGFRSAQERAWQNKLAKGFNTTDVPMEFCLLSGDVAEAFDAWRKDRDAGEELADAAIYLLGLAEMTGVDLQAEVEAKLAKNAEREYERVPGGALVKSAPEADRQADGNEPGEGASRLDHPAQRQARWMGHHTGLVAPEPEVTDTATTPRASRMRTSASPEGLFGSSPPGLPGTCGSPRGRGPLRRAAHRTWSRQRTCCASGMSSPIMWRRAEMGRFRRARRETALERDLRRAAEELEHAGPWALPATAEQRIRAEIALRLGISRDRLDQASRGLASDRPTLRERPHEMDRQTRPRRAGHGSRQRPYQGAWRV